jgi:hypothetical protein
MSLLSTVYPMKPILESSKSRITSYYINNA